MDDDVGALGRALQALRVVDVADRRLAAPGVQPPRVGGVAHECADGEISRPELLDDVAADEAGGAGDEDHSKFFQ
ncbi:MAG TPA: hypothetical protein VNT23_08675 [Gaiellaceae bacterium]|nr:hypothetical protein [Gaiellaceae bacterium]